MYFRFLILILLMTFGCTYNGFDPEEWGGGDNELELQISKSDIVLLDTCFTIDTVYVYTNGDRWDFTIEQAVNWCRGYKQDSLLLLYINRNADVKSRYAKVCVKAFYNRVSVSKEIYVSQPGTGRVDVLDTVGKHFVEPIPDYELSYDIEWSGQDELVWWQLDEGVTNAILLKLGIYDGDFFEDIIRGKVEIKGYNADGTLTSNILNTMPLGVGYKFAKNGTVTNDSAVILWDFTHSDNVYCYDCGRIYFYSGNVENINAVYNAYYVFTSGKRNFVLKLTLNVSKSLPSMVQVVKAYELNFDVQYRENYDSRNGEVTIEPYMGEIQNLLGGKFDVVYVLLDTVWIPGYRNDWWIGNGGAVIWDAYQTAVRLCPDESGVFETMVIPAGYDRYVGNSMNARYLFINSSQMRAVQIQFTIRVVE